MIKLNEKDFLEELDYCYNILIKQLIEKEDSQKKEGRKTCTDVEFLKGRLDGIIQTKNIIKKHSN